MIDLGEHADLVVLIDDMVPPLGPYCPWGVRHWFKAHGLDFKLFVREGIRADVLLAFDDHLTNEIVRLKLERLDT